MTVADPYAGVSAPVVPRPPKILYVCSAARCGSTVTDMFFGGHPQAASLGELNFLSLAIKRGAACSCGALVSACSRWAAGFDAIRMRLGVDLIRNPYGLALWDARSPVWIDPERETTYRRQALLIRRIWLTARAWLPASLSTSVGLPSLLEQAIHNKMALYDALSACWRRDVIVDSSKNAFEAIELARRWPERVLVILLTRDGRGVYLSRRSSGRSRSESIAGWKAYYQRALPLLLTHVAPQNLVRVRYEEFAANPSAIGRLICDRLAIPFDPRMCDLSAGERHMVSGNDTRFSPGKGIRLDERWRLDLQGEELAYFLREGGRLNAQLGYT